MTQVIPRLTRWGLGPDADLIYRALSMVGPRTVSELSRELSMPHRRVTQALDELAAAGAADPVQTASTASVRPHHRAWAPVPIDRLLGVLRRRRTPATPQQVWRRHVAALSGVADTVVDSSVVRHWQSRTAARQRAAQLVAAERHEHLVINTEEVFDQSARAAAAPLERSMFTRGIRVQVIEQPPSDGDRSAAEADAFAAIGGSYRQHADLPMKIMIYDRRAALFPADPLNLELGYFEVGPGPTLQGLCAMFDRTWGQAHDPRRRGVPSIGLNSREQALVALLAAGHSDQSAADELQLSLRTVAYTMRALMDRLGVESRFQLGLLLGAAGVVQLPVPVPRATS